MLLQWESDRTFFDRCLKYGLLDDFRGVIYRDNGRLQINIGEVSYFKNDEDFYAYRDEFYETLPEWVLRSKDLTSFNRTLTYLVEFIRKLEVFAINREVTTDYDQKRKTAPEAP